MGVLGLIQKRLLHVTQGGLRNGYLHVEGLFDFFPLDSISIGRRGVEAPGGVDVQLDGLAETVTAGVGTLSRVGRTRNLLYGKDWVARFCNHHRVRPGAELVLERIGERRYRLSPEKLRPTNLPRFRAAEFFAGIGLVRLALEARGIGVVFANDIDPDKLVMYRENFGDEHFILGDIHRLKAKEVPPCDLFTASFPCTDLSIAGAMRGIHRGESSAYWGFIDIVKGMGSRRPQLILLENVVGFLMSGGGKDFESALLALNRLGYACDAVIIDAARFVPQSRVRLFVIAKLGKESGGTQELQASSLRPRSLVEFMIAHPNIKWNIASLPEPPVLNKTLADIVEILPDGDPAWWNASRTDYFMNQLSEKHAAIARKLIAAPRVSYATAFRRVRHGKSMAELRADGIAGCLRTPRGGSGRQILFVAGNGSRRVRLLTPRECARLQGVPDSYAINVSSNKALFGFGDAVCVPAITWLIEKGLLPELHRVKKEAM